MPANPTKKEPASEAAYIFKGTVEKLKAATMKNVPVDNRTVVVRVDQVIEAPKNLADVCRQGHHGSAERSSESQSGTRDGLPHQRMDFR